MMKEITQRTPYVVGVLLAAGSGERMRSTTKKAFLSVGNRSLLRRSAEAFESCEEIAAIVAVVPEDCVEEAERELAGLTKVKACVIGGAFRAESAKRGVLAARPEGIAPEQCFVAVHDAARCLVCPEDIRAVISAAVLRGAASASFPATDTVKRVDDEGRVLQTLPRGQIALAMTPQVFRLDLYLRALDTCSDLSSLTDDNSLFEQAGIPVYCVRTGKNNFKITFPEDVALANALLSGTEEASDMGEYRIGHGYDVHAFADGRSLILGGVCVPFERGLAGHSDADVLVHAIMDALLGAVGEGDIGRHFPDRDPAYLNISSLVLLERTAEILAAHGARVINLDTTVVLQAPKIAPYIGQMREQIARTLGIARERINIKATTEEHLGFTGRGEGAAAHAVASVFLDR